MVIQEKLPETILLPRLAADTLKWSRAASNEGYLRWWEHEAFVLPRRGAMIGEEGEIPGDEGNVVYIPPAEHHQFVNRGDKVLRFLKVLPIPQRTSL